MTISVFVAESVRARAAGRCEYCCMHQSLQAATFHIEHVRPLALGGQSSIENLALACPSCNLHKADRVSAIDPATGVSAPLFNPREHRWSEHFTWHAAAVAGITAIGRATVHALQLNHPRRLKVREAEARFGLFPLKSQQ
jgi:hypothetical protein